MALRTLTIDPHNRLSINIAGKLTCRCPINGRRDFATVEVSYTPSSGQVVELESFSAFLGDLADRTVSHEVVTLEIGSAIEEATQADDITVRTRWDAIEGVECVVVAHQ